MSKCFISEINTLRNQDLNSYVWVPRKTQAAIQKIFLPRDPTSCHLKSKIVKSYSIIVI